MPLVLILLSLIFASCSKVEFVKDSENTNISNEEGADSSDSTNSSDDSIGTDDVRGEIIIPNQNDNTEEEQPTPSDPVSSDPELKDLPEGDTSETSLIELDGDEIVDWGTDAVSKWNILSTSNLAMHTTSDSTSGFSESQEIAADEFSMGQVIINTTNFDPGKIEIEIDIEVDQETISEKRTLTIRPVVSLFSPMAQQPLGTPIIIEVSSPTLADSIDVFEPDNPIPVYSRRDTEAGTWSFDYTPDKEGSYQLIAKITHRDTEGKPAELATKVICEGYACEKLKINNACNQGAKINLATVIKLPRKYNCEFGAGENLSMLEAHVRAHKVSLSTLELPDNAVLCQIRKLESNYKLHMDDHHVVTFNGISLSSNLSVAVDRMDRLDNLPQWNWLKVRGLGDLSFKDVVTGHCLGEAELMSSCEYPGHDQTDYLRLQFNEALSQKFAAIGKVAQGNYKSHEVGINIFGDNNAGDCELTDLNPNISTYGAIEGPDKYVEIRLDLDYVLIP